MRTTLDIDDDVLELARGLARARRISLGDAVSYLIRRGITARTPHRVKNGFHVFSVESGPEQFHLQDVEDALDDDDQAAGSAFWEQE